MARISAVTASRYLLAATLTLFFTTGCKSEPTASAASGAREPRRLQVTSTIGMITDLVRQIGGDKVAVRGLMGPGTDPHLYKASERDIRLLATADVVFYNGLHLEGKMGQILERLGRKKPVIAVSESIPRDKLRAPPAFNGNHDPHIWFDVTLWISAAERIRDGLIEHARPHAALFRRHANALLERLRELHRWIGRRIATIPRERRVLVTAHDAFGYFGRAYGIEVRAIQGISTEDEAGVQEINKLVAFIVKRGVKAVFVESSVSPKNIRALIEGARAHGKQVAIGGELFSDAMGAAGTAEGTYEGMVRHNVETIVKALR